MIGSDFKNKPNCFILGAPKCGTTSIAEWLSEHPDVFVCPGKEPHYFNTDSQNQLTKNENSYRSLFVGADNKKVIVDASVWYLYSKEAVKNIERYLPNSKYIVCVRYPVDAVISLFMEHRYSGVESSLTVEKGWELSVRRERGENNSILCRDSRLLNYKKVYKFFEQIMRLYSLAEPNRVKIIFLDDMKADPLTVMNEVAVFLELQPYNWSDLGARNVVKQRKSQGFNNFLRVIGRIKEYFGIKRGFGLLRFLQSRNVEPAVKPEVTLQFRQSVYSNYKDDINSLAELTGRDLLKLWGNK